MWLWDKGKADVWLCGLLILDEASGRPTRVRMRHALSTLSFSTKTKSFWSQKDAPFLHILLLSISTHAFLFDNLGKQNETRQYNLVVARDDFFKLPNLSRSILSRHIIRAVVTLDAHCSCEREQQRIEAVGISERGNERWEKKKGRHPLGQLLRAVLFFGTARTSAQKNSYCLGFCLFTTRKTRHSNDQ